MKVTRAVIVLEINGKPHQVIMPENGIDVLITALSSLEPEGLLRVFELPEDFKFAPLSEIIKTP